MTTSEDLPLIKTGVSIIEAMAAISAGACHIAIIVDAENRIQGVVSDGDVRRAILNGIDTQTTVDGIMNSDPLVAGTDDDDELKLRLMEQNAVTAIPLLDDKGRVVAISRLYDLVNQRSKFGQAVIFAGGEGQRLRPITEELPKPMVTVGDKPLIQHSVARLAESGVGRIHVAVNYKGKQIQDHFGDGSAFGADIGYLEETTRLGTAGALGLLTDIPDGPLLVMNGDILTTFDFASMFLFHHKMESALTVGVVDYSMDIPYGVIATADGVITGLEEKPSHSVHINAGVYAIEPRLLALIPGSRVYNMTDLIADALKAGEKIVPFLIHEHWIDVGTPEDLERAQNLARTLAAATAEDTTGH